MRATVRKPMTRVAFLEWEERQTERFEFDGFQPVAMTGGTNEHSLIQTNVIVALRQRAQGGPCRVHAGHLKVETAAGYRYPDAFVTCTPVPRGATVVEPVVVFEVISPSTAATDRIVKVREYGATPAIRRYVILEPDARAATIFSHDQGVWSGVVIDGEADLDLPELGITVPLAELYQDVALPAGTEG
jgi:Uma2 family endonuclease